MHFRSLICAIAAIAVLATASIALAAPTAAPTTETTHEHNGTETFVDVGPNCDGSTDLFTITIVYNSVDHATLFPDGRVHGTFTQTGTFSAVPLDPSLPSGEGHFTIWGNFNDNGKTVNGTFTFNLNGTASDGSQLQHHETQHFNVRPDGTVNEFFRCH